MIDSSQHLTCKLDTRFTDQTPRWNQGAETQLHQMVMAAMPSASLQFHTC
ncbi:hypothetical protein O9992_20925 [Vibrio lentus]|nr:hypothetical protein [Vibrio lentus]